MFFKLFNIHTKKRKLGEYLFTYTTQEQGLTTEEDTLSIKRKVVLLVSNSVSKLFWPSLFDGHRIQNKSVDDVFKMT